MAPLCKSADLLHELAQNVGELSEDQSQVEGGTPRSERTAVAHEFFVTTEQA